ncbi:helix-turn-helix domain-containing protein [Adhaeribacter soli]|uniref:Helix-turn-helix transcriptional regulator n=1 Tax=Adhaeribacter soli TaxID=2607655 RepID=A0A5N1IS63_9BACT|nr:helix-turn-helix transcriptional regulator [Adhaeribacter soli]KAA9332761.1 helix-turn-helix transcriptional regulator [Adhaeribacter soli]
MKNTSDLEKFTECSVSYRLKVIQEKLKIRSVAAFANEIGVDTSVLNNIMSPYGRKGKPSFDTLQKIAARYPRVNIDWLVTGKGEPLRPFSAVYPAGTVDGANLGSFPGENLKDLTAATTEAVTAELEPAVNELKSMLKVCQLEKENLEKILTLKDELIGVLKQQK